MHDRGNRPGPPGLVAGADAGAVVAMDVFVEQDEIAPVRILLKLCGAAVYRPAAILAPQEDPRKPLAEIFGHFVQRFLLTRPGGTLHTERIAVIKVGLQQSADDQDVDRHPDWAPPVGIA